MKENRCWGMTKISKRCGRKGNWSLFCEDHKNQWIKGLFFVIAIPVIPSIIASFLYSWGTDSKTEKELSVKVQGENAIDKALSQAKMEGANLMTPSATEVIAKFFVLPSVTTQLDTAPPFALVSVSPFKPLNSDLIFDAGDCRFLGYVIDFYPLSRAGIFSIETISCTDNNSHSYSLKYDNYKNAPQGLLAELHSPTELHLTLSQEQDGIYSMPLYSNALVKFVEPVSALNLNGRAITRF
ncbi:hypothetical protein H5A18_14100 [Pectobacterium brasiliense]|uniref:hypothetical protein n=1 Tax=Pectobacterium brasiliense TaxID=180957 RepID=UPI000CE698C5|nr:hypothetical protein [Pectobacterium brasiliense]MBN3183031.1 hypothetical protein [Pectobacterium brasiliense]PPE64324.1 hypothetical protein F152LOC_00446 [Pectobacterium brasiliense]